MAASAGAWASYQNRQLYIQAALYAEGYTISADAKHRVARYYEEYNRFPQDNEQAELPPPQAIFGTSVKRVSLVRDGVILVEFNDDMGDNTMQLIPEANIQTGYLTWSCASDSIPENILEKLRPACLYLPTTSESLLSRAIADQDMSRIKELMRDGVDLEMLINGNTPLMLASKIGNMDIVNLLLESGAHVDHVAANSERRTPLMVAISSAKADIVTLLLSQGASLIRKDYSGRSALDYAREVDSRNGDERFELMLSAGFNPLFRGRPQASVQELSPAMQQRYFKELFQQFESAADACHVKRAETLIKENQPGSDLSRIKAYLAGLIGASDCPEKMRDMYVTEPAWLDAYRGRLEQSVERCDVKLVEQLRSDYPQVRLADLYHAAPADYESFTVQALSVGCSELLSRFLRPGIDTEVRQDLIVEAIMNAPQHTLLRTVAVLIEHGADVNQINDNRMSPLVAAISYEQPVVAKYLVDAGADVNQMAPNGSYPLIDATMKGYYHLVGHFLMNGANVNQRDSLGRTALHAAVAKGRQRTVNILLQAGADRRIRDENGMDAVVMAESRKHYTIHAMLLDD